jgi:hypothetical protein
MIDELIHDALAAQIPAAEVEPVAPTWARVGAAGRLARQRRRRRTAGALAAAVVVIAVIAAVGIAQGTPSSEKVATSPTTGTVAPPTTARAVAPPPAPSVAEPLWQSTSLRSGFSVVSWAGGGSWTAARTAGDGLELALTTSGCGDRFGAVVQDLGNRVSVQLAVADGPHLSCLMTEQVHVRLPDALDGRPLVDGSSGAAMPVLDGSALLVPHGLPAGMRLQTESLSIQPFSGSSGRAGERYRAWSACYQADLPAPPTGEKAVTTTQRCVFTGSIPMVTTAQSTDTSDVLDTGVLAQDSISASYSFGFCGCVVYESGPPSPQPGRSLPATPVPGGVDGHPASVLSTGLHDVVVWTDGHDWYSVATPHGVGGVSTAEVIRIAQSMRPVG